MLLWPIDTVLVGALLIVISRPQFCIVSGYDVSAACAADVSALAKKMGQRARIRMFTEFPLSVFMTPFPDARRFRAPACRNKKTTFRKAKNVGRHYL